MATLSTLLNAAPGVYVRTSTAGGAPASLVFHDNVYAFVEVPSSVSLEDFPIRTPLLLNSFFDYQVLLNNTIPLGGAERTCYNWVRMLFRNSGTSGQIYVIRIPGPNSRGNLYSFTPFAFDEDNHTQVKVKLEGFNPIKIDLATDDDTPLKVSMRVKSAIESDPGYSSIIYIRTLDPTSGTILFSPRDANQPLELKAVSGLEGTPLPNDNLPVSTDVSLNGSPVGFLDYLDAINTSFNLETDLPGFLCAPGAFAHMDRADRFVVGQAMEQFASMPEVQWMAIIDCGPTGFSPVAAETQNRWLKSGQTNPVTPGALIDKLCTKFETMFEELNSYTSPAGHSAVIAPYAVDFEGFVVPGSAYQVGIALMSMAAAGIAQPPAGVRYAIRGIRKLTHEYNKSQHTLCNNNHINLAVVKPRWGPVVFGSRTRSFSPFWRFINTRVIINTYIATLKRGFDEILFRAPDGRGGIFSDILATAENISHRFYQGGAFYGARPEDAYYLKCDEQNNPPAQIENGSIVLQCWVVPAPTLERLLIEVIRVPIGQLASVIARVQEGG